MSTLKELAELIQRLSDKIDKLEQVQNKSSGDDKINAAAAKIIKDLSEKMDKCECTEKLKKELKFQNDKEQPIVPSQKENSDKGKSPLAKYSYPNHRVGNPDLGQSKDPGSLTWPFGS